MYLPWAYTVARAFRWLCGYLSVSRLPPAKYRGGCQLLGLEYCRFWLWLSSSCYLKALDGECLST